jgi:hypothetical protein
LSLSDLIHGIVAIGVSRLGYTIDEEVDDGADGVAELEVEREVSNNLDIRRDWPNGFLKLRFHLLGMWIYLSIFKYLKLTC